MLPCYASSICFFPVIKIPAYDDVNIVKFGLS